MVNPSALRFAVAAGALFAAPSFAISDASAQANPLPAVPAQLSQRVRDSLEIVRANLTTRIDAYKARAIEFNAACAAVVPGSSAAAACFAGRDAMGVTVASIKSDRASYVQGVAALVAAIPPPNTNAKVDRVAPVEPPSPVIDEEAEFYKDPIGWRDRQELRVRHAVFLQKKWTGEVLKAIKARTSIPSTTLSTLSEGDVLLVAPIAHKLDPAEHLKGVAIAIGDYELRAISAFASGGLLAAAQVAPRQLSHSITFLREVNGRKLFLDHDLSGTHVIDEAGFLKEYGARQMLVARPQEIVDGRELWQAAREYALRQRGYGVTGGRVVCSDMCLMAVARATKVEYSGGNLGPIDVTPADFYDKRGNVGKHFVVSRLQIVPVPKTP